MMAFATGFRTANKTGRAKLLLSRYERKLLNYWRLGRSLALPAQNEWSFVRTCYSFESLEQSLPFHAEAVEAILEEVRP